MASSEIPANGTYIEVIYLTFWDKVAIAGGALGFLLLISICMVCFLCPECICYGVCFGDEDNSAEKKKKESKNKKFGEWIHFYLFIFFLSYIKTKMPVFL